MRAANHTSFSVKRKEKNKKKNVLKSTQQGQPIKNLIETIFIASNQIETFLELK